MTILHEGQVIRDTYEVERLLGEGAFAEVYRVRHRFLGRQALKVFKRTGLRQSEVEEMLGEAILLSRIGHPNIVRVFDANVFESSKGLCGFFTMEYVPGGSLDRYWGSFGNKFVPLEQSISVMRQVCRGLAVAHAESPPIIHRDIKPQNILIGYEVDGLRARVSDFGLAKTVNPLTLIATAAGTLGFKAPESFSKAPSDSCASDVWALGVTLYLLLTDRLPFTIDPARGWNNAGAFKTGLVLPSRWNLSIDKSMDSIVSRCLQVDPLNRFPNANELLAALEDWQPHEEAPSRVDHEHVDNDLFKSVLGPRSSPEEAQGQSLARQALEKARGGRSLAEAADLMEEAFNQSPALRERYANRVQLWRRGISM